MDRLGRVDVDARRDTKTQPEVGFGKTLIKAGKKERSTVCGRKSAK